MIRNDITRISQMGAQEVSGRRKHARLIHKSGFGWGTGQRWSETCENVIHKLRERSERWAEICEIDT